MAPSFARLACALVFLAVVVDAMPNPTIYDAWFYAASAVAQAGFTKYFLSVFFERHAWVYCGYTWASVTWVIAIIHFVIAHYEKQVKVQAKSIRNLGEPTCAKPIYLTFDLLQRLPQPVPQGWEESQLWSGG